jgi:hypothetical protein
LNELVIADLQTKLTAGTITSNAAAMLQAVKQGVAKYADPNYEPTEKGAKADRAMLNRAEKSVAAEAKKVRDNYNKPLEEFNNLVAEIRSTIKDASAVVDGAVKAYEEKQKEAKLAQIQEYFTGKKFDLVPLEKIFDQKWLNKTAKMPDIRKAIDDQIAEIYQNIKVLENIADYGATAKAFYLDSLDMAAAMRQVDTMKANAERLAREKAERAEREQREAVEANRQEQMAEAREEARSQQAEEAVGGLAAEALGIAEPETPAAPQPVIVECTLRLWGQVDALKDLLAYMTAHNVAYVKEVKEHRKLN